jgi:uncharacterized protein YihD (DUF1040 family)
MLAFIHDEAVLMRDPNRIPLILKRLETVWKKSPDLRLGQLISLIAEGSDTFMEISNRIFFIEDDELIRKLEEHLLEIPWEETEV